MLREGQSLVKYNSWLRWQQGRCKLEYLPQKTVILHEFKFSAVKFSGLRLLLLRWSHQISFKSFSVNIRRAACNARNARTSTAIKIEAKKWKQILKKTRRRERINALSETASNKFYIKLSKWMVNYKNFFTASCRVIFTFRFLYISILHF